MPALDYRLEAHSLFRRGLGFAFSGDPAMLSFLLGSLAMLVVVTFAPPHIAARPSELLRSLVGRFRSSAD